jgi:hypothetical protein
MKKPRKRSLDRPNTALRRDTKAGASGQEHPAALARPSRGNEARRHLWRLAPRVGAIATVLVALWGAFTGTTAWLEDRRVDIDVFPQRFDFPSENGPQFVPYVQVDLVNDSRRGVTLTSGEVRHDGNMVGTLWALRRDKRITDSGAPTSLTLEPAEPLPVTLPPESSFQVTLLWNLTGISTRTGIDAAIQKLLENGAAIEEFEVSLDFVPGGSREVSVRSSRDDVGPRLPENVAVLIFRTRTVIGMRIAWDEPSYEMATLRLWRGEASRPSRVVRRPGGEHDELLFPLPELPRGRYTWAIAIRNEIISVGRFTTPCSKVDQRSRVVESWQACS